MCLIFVGKSHLNGKNFTIYGSSQFERAMGEVNMLYIIHVHVAASGWSVGAGLAKTEGEQSSDGGTEAEGQREGGRGRQDGEGSQPSTGRAHQEREGAG